MGDAVRKVSTVWENIGITSFFIAATGFLAISGLMIYAFI